MSFLRFVWHWDIILNFALIRKTFDHPQLLHLDISDAMLYLDMVWFKKLFPTRKRVIWTLILISVIILGKVFLFSPKNVASDSAVVRRGDIKQELTLSGQIDAQDHVVLSFGIPGRVSWVGVKEGEWVKKNQAIAALDTEVLNAALRQAWQGFTAAKATSDKYYDGRNPNASESYDEKITRTAVDAAQNTAYDSVRIAQENLKSASLYSPIDGLVIGVNPDIAGVNVTAMNSSYEIVNPSTVFLKVTADQTEVGDIKAGQKGTIIFDSYPEEKIEGIIDSISFAPAKDEIGTVYDAKIILSGISNKDYKFRLGMTADVNFILKNSKDTLILSSEYVKVDDDNRRYVLKGKEKIKTFIEVGVESETNIEVTSGLSEGDVIYD
jgi:membrane fusion protein, multidrug efflux system